MQGTQRQHSGCHLGRIYSTSIYSPFRLIRWKDGKVAMQDSLADMDPLKALELCSPRFPASAPFPTLACIRPEWVPFERDEKRAKRSRPQPASCASVLPDQVQNEVCELIQAAMQRSGYKLSSEAEVQPAHFSSIKQQGAGILAAGRFFCKVAGDYHSSSTSYFMLWPSGELVQKCHKTGCDGRRVSLGVFTLPPDTAALLGKGSGKKSKT